MKSILVKRTVRRQPEGMEAKKSVTVNACRGNSGHYRSEVPLFSDAQGMRLIM